VFKKLNTNIFVELLHSNFGLISKKVKLLMYDKTNVIIMCHVKIVKKLL
jgi:hypothetical protein